MAFLKDTLPGIQLPEGVDLFRQMYESVQLPQDVMVLKTNVYYDDWGGYFKENIRIDDEGFVISLREKGILFKGRQNNTSELKARMQRFWHIHPKQNELWSSSKTLLVGLVDLREGSHTYGVKSKVILSIDKLLYIPAGVAH